MSSLGQRLGGMVRRLRGASASMTADGRPTPVAEADRALPASNEAPVEASMSTGPSIDPADGSSGGPSTRAQPTVDLDIPRTSWEPRVDALIRRHEGDLVGGLLAINEAFGFLPRNVLVHVARRTETPLVRIVGIASYYRRFRLEPVGRHRLSVCLGTACHVAGGPSMVEALGARLRVAPGGTSKDGLVTLETVACLGCCSLAPVLTVNETIRGRVRNVQALRIVDALLEGAS